jgi:hypothetical protein
LENPSESFMFVVPATSSKIATINNTHPIYAPPRLALCREQNTLRLGILRMDLLGRCWRHLAVYSPNCLEEVFSETGLPVNEVLGTSRV